MPVRLFKDKNVHAKNSWWRDVDQAPDQFEALEEWTECGNAARKNIDKYVQSWRTEMDTLLVFGSLFSAIVTAFVIESYAWLQKDSTDGAVLILLHISAQLANQTQEIAQFPPYAPTASQVIINVFWFTSLILSLTAILLAIMIKQWLSEYSWPNTGSISARHTLALRQIRIDSLYDWHLSTIVDWLPLVMISSLFFFLGGLGILLFTMNIIVASFAAGFMSISFVAFFITSALPTFAPECSYRSAQSYLFFLVFRPVMAMFTKVPKSWKHINGQTRARIAQVEPHALIWILMNVCPWQPLMYPKVSACARSLNRSTSSRTACELFRVSILHEPVQYTTEQARRWKSRIGPDEFLQTCVLLTKEVENMLGVMLPGQANADDVVSHIRTLSLFFSIPDYLPNQDEELFWKSLSIMVATAIDEQLPTHIPETKQQELKMVVRKHLHDMVNLEWPRRISTLGQDYTTLLLFPAVAAAIRSQSNNVTDPEEFIFLSTFALSLSRRMTQKETLDSESHMIALVKSMTEFTVANTGGTSVTTLRRAISHWMPVWFGPFSNSYWHGKEGTGRNSNAGEPSVHDVMGNLLESLSRAESLDAGLWKGYEKHRDRLGPRKLHPIFVRNSVF